MGGNSSGSANTHGFQESLAQGIIPTKHKITFDGSFNENCYAVGPQISQTVGLQYYSALSKNPFNNQKEIFVACFLKSKFDGMPRKKNQYIDFVAILDKSGSMNLDLGNSQSSRLKLAQESLIQMIQILLPDDRFGLGVFTEIGEILLPLTFKKNIDMNKVKSIINDIEANGGTLLEAGMKSGVQILQEAEQLKIADLRERRIIMLTDMDDMQGSVIRSQIKQNAEQYNINTSIIAISSEYNAELCMEVVKEQGANYIPITNESQIHKALINDFQYNFFPVAHSVFIEFQSPQFQLDKCYGTPLGFKRQNNPNA